MKHCRGNKRSTMRLLCAALLELNSVGAGKRARCIWVMALWRGGNTHCEPFW